MQARTGQPIPLEKPPPQPLPENLWGESWRFAAVPAAELAHIFDDRPIPILTAPDELLPFNLGLASTVPIPGVIVYGGRRSLGLARWLQEVQPYALHYIPTASGQGGGLVLEAGLNERWILATFEDPAVAKAAQTYQERQQASRGLHFLLVQPDDSGLTDTGFWLLREEEE